MKNGMKEKGRKNKGNSVWNSSFHRVYSLFHFTDNGVLLQEFFPRFEKSRRAEWKDFKSESSLPRRWNNRVKTVQPSNSADNGGYDKYADGRLMRLTAALPQIRVRNSGIQSECGDDARTEGYEGKFRHRNRRSPIPPVLLRLRLRPPRRNFRHGPGNTRPGPGFSSLSSSDQESRNRTSVHFHAPVSSTLLAPTLVAPYNRKLTKVSSHVREVGSKHRAPLRSEDRTDSRPEYDRRGWGKRREGLPTSLITEERACYTESFRGERKRRRDEFLFGWEGIASGHSLKSRGGYIYKSHIEARWGSRFRSGFFVIHS